MKPAALYRLAKASGHGKATLTIARHDGHTYAGWSHGCVLLPDPLVDRLGYPEPGTYLITSNGDLTNVSPTSAFNPETITRQALPLLDKQPRTAVTDTPWIYQRGHLNARYLLHPDATVVVHDPHWQAWSAALSGVRYAVPLGRIHAIAWAADPQARATGFLLTAHTGTLPPRPEGT
ncbi:hypothetical protein [Herbidospora daliensis]|uniref:hypothetical protein n=1 Tax=Herbidospora daliensis TaxID=295585 RepID=UPI0007835B6D|nr:hypothetical protein [Herbidospora daliensis]